MTAYRGIDVRDIDTGMIFRAFLIDSTGAMVTAGTAYLSLFELQTDGTLKTFDWAAGAGQYTFKAAGLNAGGHQVAMTHRTGIQTGDAALNTGLWTVALTTLTGFTAGRTYIFSVYHASASPTTQGRQFQAGGGIQSDVAFWIGTAPLALSSQQVQAVVPITQKVDVETIKAKGVTVDSGGTTFPASVAATGEAATAASGLAAAIDTQLSVAHGAGPWGAGSGTTATVYTVTVGGVPEAGVYCRLTSDIVGLVNVDAGVTNSLGQVIFHHNLPSGTTVYIWGSKDGVEFADPDIEVIP